MTVEEDLRNRLEDLKKEYKRVYEEEMREFQRIFLHDKLLTIYGNNIPDKHY